MPPEVKDRRDIAVPELRRPAGLAEKALGGRRVIEIRGADDLERDGAAQVRVEGLVGQPHRAVAEFDEGAVLVF